MPKLAKRIVRVAKRTVKEIGTRVSAMQARRSMKNKVATVKRVTKDALKAAAIAGAIAATTTVLNDRKKRLAVRS